MTKNIIVVFGATGKTGGGMIDYILEDGTFAARAATRNPDSDKAKALVARGVEVVQADLNDTQSLTKAMQGAYGVFGMTNYWEAFQGEVQQGKNLVDAAKAAGIQHFAWATLDSSELKVPHWETKAAVDEYLKASGVPRTSLYNGFFTENFASFTFKRNDANEIVLDIPFKTDGELPCMPAHDIGGLALVAFKNPEEWLGKDIKLIVEWVTPRQIAGWVEESIGEKVKIVEVDDAKWPTLRKEGNDEMWRNMEFFYTHKNDRDAEPTKKLLPKALKAKDLVQSRGDKMIH